MRVKGKGGFKPLHSHDSKTGAVGIGKILISKFVEDPPSPSFNLFINGHDLNLITLFDGFIEGYSGIGTQSPFQPRIGLIENEVGR